MAKSMVDSDLRLLLEKCGGETLKTALWQQSKTCRQH
jgi:hypothetical protein